MIRHDFKDIIYRKGSSLTYKNSSRNYFNARTNIIIEHKNNCDLSHIEHKNQWASIGSLAFFYFMGMRPLPPHLSSLWAPFLSYLT